MQPLNSPVEVGLRAVILLTETFPSPLDIDRLMVLDYYLLHSDDLDGPPSLLPSLSTRSGELAEKRQKLSHGLQLMERAGLIELTTSGRGLTYRASEDASAFLQLVRTELVMQLREIARWVVREIGTLSAEELYTQTNFITKHWSTEGRQESENREALGMPLRRTKEGTE